MKQRIYIKDLSHHVGETVTIAGWVHVRRDQGKMVFFDFRDMTGVIQGVTLPGSPALDIAKEIRPEWVVTVTGIVNERPEKMKKVDTQNGDIELEITTIEILNQAETPPFEVTEDSSTISEDVRLKHRYIDLRTNRMQKNIRARHRVVKFIRDYLDTELFTEIETPIFTKTTPEGARDYLVPSRLSPGNFYALPQSPQQYKQLLMASGMERYFQIARCFRDEDLRGDRQPEFTQVDMEMSFVTEEDVIELNERLLIALVTKLYPEKKIQQVPFPRITYAEAMETYGNDRPDIREDKDDPNLLAFCWVVDFPMFEPTATSDDPTATGEWTFTHNPFSSSKPDHIEWLMSGTNIGNIQAAQYDIVLNGYEIGGGSIRTHRADVFEKVLGILGHTDEAIQKNFGHMIQAFRSGTPPHGGIAWGLERLVMLLQNEPNIREVMAFPKNGEGRCVMMESPSPANEKQLEELGIVLRKKN